MKSDVVVCIGIILALTKPIFAGDLHDCPIELVCGTIQDVDSSYGGKVWLFRGDKKMTAQRGQCLLYEDKVVADPLVTVYIATASMNYTIGRNQSSREWKAPTAPTESTMSWMDVIQRAFEAIRDDVLAPFPAQGRGGNASSCPDSPGDERAIEPLIHFPTVRQRLGADISKLIVAWKYRSDNKAVTIQLSHSDGSVVVPPERICQKSHASILIPPQEMRAGDVLILEVIDITGNRLKWIIDIVAPEKLPRPGSRTSDSWLTGVWRLLEKGDEFNLDAVSRISEESEHAYGALWFLQAILSNYEFRS